MRSQQLQLDLYDTDKVRNGYLRWYDEILGAGFASVHRVLELGVHHGGSIALWRDYFPNAVIAGIDADLTQFRCIDQTRIEVFEGSQTDPELLHRIARTVAPDGFDVIIDDASHIAWKTEIAFWALLEHLRPGGHYIIEDWGTGYHHDWPDGRRAKSQAHRTTRASRAASRLAGYLGVYPPQRSHEHGMVGFIKKLIDEQGMGDLSGGTRSSKFAAMTITPGLVAIRKAAAVRP